VYTLSRLRPQRDRRGKRRRQRRRRVEEEAGI